MLFSQFTIFNSNLHITVNYNLHILWFIFIIDFVTIFIVCTFT